MVELGKRTKLADLLNSMTEEGLPGVYTRILRGEESEQSRIAFEDDQGLSYAAYIVGGEGDDFREELVGIRLEPDVSFASVQTMEGDSRGQSIRNVYRKSPKVWDSLSMKGFYNEDVTGLDPERLVRESPEDIMKEFRGIDIRGHESYALDSYHINAFSRIYSVFGIKSQR